MVGARIIAASLMLLALGAPALAEQRGPGSGGYSLKPLVTPASATPAPAAPAPYAMNYSEQVAKSLKVEDGGVGLLPRQEGNPYAPSVSFNGSMLRLKWRP